MNFSQCKERLINSDIFDLQIDAIFILEETKCIDCLSENLSEAIKTIRVVYVNNAQLNRRIRRRHNDLNIYNKTKLLEHV